MRMEKLSATRSRARRRKRLSWSLSQPKLALHKPRHRSSNLNRARWSALKKTSSRLKCARIGSNQMVHIVAIVIGASLHMASTSSWLEWSLCIPTTSLSCAPLSIVRRGTACMDLDASSSMSRDRLMRWDSSTTSISFLLWNSTSCQNSITRVIPSRMMSL